MLGDPNWPDEQLLHLSVDHPTPANRSIVVTAPGMLLFDDAQTFPPANWLWSWQAVVDGALLVNALKLLVMPALVLVAAHWRPGRPGATDVRADGPAADSRNVLIFAQRDGSHETEARRRSCCRPLAS